MSPDPDLGSDKHPASVKKWQKKFYERRQICGFRCRKHSRKHSNGFCERETQHPGLHSHELRQGMTEYDSTWPKGCAWGVNSSLRKTVKRTKPPKVTGPF